MKKPLLPLRRSISDPRPARTLAQILIDAGVDVPIGADEAWLAMEACAQVLAHAPTPQKGARR